MTQAELKAYGLGLYRVYWKDGSGPSLAAVGQLYDGRKWLAPINWTAKEPKDIATVKGWRMVEMIVPVNVP